MRARFDAHQRDREAASVEPETGLKVWTQDAPRPWAKVWMPKATRPFVNYTFRSVEQRDEYVARTVAGVKVSQATKAAAREARKRPPEHATAVEVGTIFCHSWGYDQTNIDYYEVTKKSGSYVEVKPIASTEVPGSQGFMCATVKPVPGAFLSKTYRLQDAHGNYKQSLRKKVQYTERGEAYLSFEYGWCGVSSPDQSRYSSWYA